jgi:hypothetical protein
MNTLIAVIIVSLASLAIVNIYTDQQIAVSAASAGLQQCRTNGYSTPIWQKECLINK